MAALSGGSLQQAPRPGERKKVRLACQRCRDRRIKCDGQMPSCSKCAKVGVACIDVDARQAGNAVPRAFLSDAQARLEWLEDIVRTQLPNIDLTSGPRKPEEPIVSNGSSENVEGESSQSLTENMPSSTVSGLKRRADATAIDPSSPALKSARRMAMDLGLFSLHRNASQAHYLGSSSGSLFASLMRRNDASPQDASQHVADDMDEASDTETEESNEGGRDRQTLHSRSHEIIGSLQDMLPLRPECDRMIKRFYSHYHPDYPVLHQPSFKSLVDALYAVSNSQDPAALQYNGWPADIPVFRYNDEIIVVAGKEAIPINICTAATQLFFVLSIASHLLSRKRSFSHDPGRFTARAMTLFQLSLADVTVASIQAIVLCILQEFLTSEGGSMWILTHIAMSFAIDLGLHRCHPMSPRVSSMAVYLRRRIFFTLYSLERYISTAQGRPIGFQDDTLDLTLPLSAPTPAENETERFDGLFMPYSITQFRSATILSDLKYQLYRFQAPDMLTEGVSASQQDMQRRLDEWLSQSLLIVPTLPKKSQLELKTKLRLQYQFAVGLLYQPSQACPTPDDSALRRCLDSATERIKLYDDLYAQKALLLSWPNTHGIFLSGAILVYCLWSCADIRTSVPIPEIAKTLRLCSNLLTLGGEWWPLAERGKRSFEKLADYTLHLLSNPPDSRSFEPHPGMDAPTMGGDELLSGFNSSEWYNVESMLQSFLQNDLQYTDMLDTLDHPSAESFDLGF